MKTPAPVHSDIRRTDIQFSSCRQTRSSILLTEVEETAEGRAIIISDPMGVYLGLGGQSPIDIDIRRKGSRGDSDISSSAPSDKSCSNIPTVIGSLRNLRNGIG